MKSTWALQDAKNGLSRVVDLALTEGPQTITRHGRDTVVILSAEEYHRAFEKEGTLVEFFRRSPLLGLDLRVERTPERPRKVFL